MSATAQGYWPSILGPMPSLQAKHFRVMAGPVDHPIRCLSIRDFREKVPNASSQMTRDANTFFTMGAGHAVLEVVPS